MLDYITLLTTFAECLQYVRNSHLGFFPKLDHQTHEDLGMSFVIFINSPYMSYLSCSTFLHVVKLFTTQ